MSQKRFKETIQTRAIKGTKRAFKAIAKKRDLPPAQVQREAFKQYISENLEAKAA